MILNASTMTAASFSAVIEPERISFAGDGVRGDVLGVHLHHLGRRLDEAAALHRHPRGGLDEVIRAVLQRIIVRVRPDEEQRAVHLADLSRARGGEPRGGRTCTS